MTLRNRLKALDDKLPKATWVDQPTDSYVARGWMAVTSPGGIFIVKEGGPPADLSLLSEGGRILLAVLFRLRSGKTLSEMIPPDEYEEFYEYLAWFLEDQGVDEERIKTVVNAVRDHRFSF